MIPFAPRLIKNSSYSTLFFCRLHDFSWHGTDPNNKTRMIAGQHCFTVLKIIPDQFYYNVS